jgi:MFS family permease
MGCLPTYSQVGSGVGSYPPGSLSNVHRDAHSAEPFRCQAWSMRLPFVMLPTRRRSHLFPTSPPFPPYYQVGLLAPWLLVLTRIVQGFAVGGEFTATMVFLVEHAPQVR